MRAPTNFEGGCREAMVLQRKGQLPAAAEVCSRTKQRPLDKRQVFLVALIKSKI